MMHRWETQEITPDDTMAVCKENRDRRLDEEHESEVSKRQVKRVNRHNDVGTCRANQMVWLDGMDRLFARVRSRGVTLEGTCTSNSAVVHSRSPSVGLARNG
jgi:hypothetical protein